MPEPTTTTSTRARRRLGLVVLVGTLLILAATIWKRQRDHATRLPADLSSLLRPEVLRQFEALEKSDHDANATVWTPEVLAQNYAASVERLWEDLNRSQDPLARLQSVPIATLTAPTRVHASDWTLSIQAWSGVIGADSPSGPVADWRWLSIPILARTPFRIGRGENHPVHPSAMAGRPPVPHGKPGRQRRL